MLFRSNEIQLILHKREESLNNAIKTFNSWKAVANFFKELLSSMCQAKKMILNDVNELKGIKAKYEILSQLRQIDINDPLSEKLTEIYIEMQGVLKNANHRPIDDLVEAIQINLNKIDHIVKKKLSTISEDGSMSAKDNQKTMATYNSSVITRRTYSTNVDYRKDIDFKQDNIKEKFLSSKEPYSPTYSQRMYDNMEFTNLVERQNEAGSLSKKSKFVNNNIVDYKRGNYNQTTFNIDLKSTNDIEKRNMLNKEATNSKKTVNLNKNKVMTRRNLEIGRKKLISFTDFNVNTKPMEEALNLLAEETKTCNVCSYATEYLLILKCCGMICKNCLKERLSNADSRILLNPDEASKRQVSMCVCPIHKTTIKAKILQTIFGSKEIEKLSIEAVKREKRQKKLEAGKKIVDSNLCQYCKKFINDDGNSIQICQIHKVCNYCYL